MINIELKGKTAEKTEFLKLKLFLIPAGRPPAIFDLNFGQS